MNAVFNGAPLPRSDALPPLPPHGLLLVVL